MSDTSKETRTSSAGANMKTFRNGDMPEDGLRNEQLTGKPHMSEAQSQGKTAGSMGEGVGILGGLADKVFGSGGSAQQPAANVNDKP
ncbi:hypothetical protein EXIGLDRAFT_841634 [Exidia glandulosa HHB12029]|uniref:Uncharacterized protein n=1 Tax=Exidia glandulosa HHB12029 TaxID=1314781 RepID=A0A165DRN3_EXIGL|nr:hypothetical protein EXIGLDRAFT_841634 [Exidia glandulosa HHB12029]